MQCQIRKAMPSDASVISQLVIEALRHSNARDYSADIIERVERSFSPSAILGLLTQRRVYVATIDQQVVATASLDQHTVRSVFVRPRHQGKGVGRSLMQAVEAAASVGGVARLRVPSSITAEGFYASLGYISIRDEFHGTERTIIMEKALL